MGERGLPSGSFDEMSVIHDSILWNFINYFLFDKYEPKIDDSGSPMPVLAKIY